MDDKLVRITISNIVDRYEHGPYATDLIDELTAVMVGAIEGVAEISYNDGVKDSMPGGDY